MDTIDVSNLNRQFLFRKEHVGKPKSEVAKDSILQHYPDVFIKAHFRSIIELVSHCILSILDVPISY